MALVFNIQRYSIHDGPGIRTTVFFKGCPLNCLWCHNPESQSFKKELMMYKDKCISCGGCDKVCEHNALSNEENCILCGACTEECPTNARVIVGKDMTVDEIMKEVEKDRNFYDQSKGGVTLSGGEPLAQGDFMLALVKRLKARGIHVTMDTCGFSSWENILRITPYVDLFLYDIKFTDDEKHRLYTGVSNKIIIENLKNLAKLNKEVQIRVPVVPGINTGDADIQGIIGLLTGIGNVNQINLLPYHNISMEKYNRLRREYELNNVSVPEEYELENIKSILEKKNFRVKIGG